MFSTSNNIFQAMANLNEKIVVENNLFTLIMWVARYCGLAPVRLSKTYSWTTMSISRSWQIYGYIFIVIYRQLLMYYKIVLLERSLSVFCLNFKGLCSYGLENDVLKASFKLGGKQSNMLRNIFLNNDVEVAEEMSWNIVQATLVSV